MMPIFDFDDSLTKIWNHIELLHDAVHIANAAQILETHIATECSLLLLDVN
jgi:hypothetical protein